jgi:hypothetical protein
MRHLLMKELADSHSLSDLQWRGKSAAVVVDEKNLHCSSPQ